jgi:hypothetical protein
LEAEGTARQLFSAWQSQQWQSCLEAGIGAQDEKRKDRLGTHAILDGLSVPPGVCAPDIRSAGPREQPASSGRIASVMAGIDAKGETLTSWLGKLCLAINVSAVKTRGRSPLEP